MESFEKLVKLFEEFPGIGPRQARRFAFFLLAKDSSYATSLSSLILNAKKSISKCADCMRFTDKKTGDLCKICRNPQRDKGVIMIVSKDSELSSVEKSDVFKGTYFVLGGIIPVLEKEPSRKIRQKELLALIERKQKDGLKEIILALNATQEGENTAIYLRDLLKNHNLKITELGRGLSTGSEVEYADPETIRFAFENKR